MDYTGKENERLIRDNADQIEQAAQQMSMTTPTPRRRKRSKEVHDFTQAAEPKIEVELKQHIEDTEPRVVRVLADIEEMTFGRRIAQEAVFDDEGNVVKAPMVGPLRVLNFKEGEMYRVDKALYDHLVFLQYVDPDEYED